MKERFYNNFWQQKHNSAKDKCFPLRVMFELTYRCNFYCQHCYVPASYRKKGELKTREVFSIVDQLADVGCFYLGFTGGEPFVREDILNIVRYAKRKGFEIIIYSNGSLIDEKVADKLANLRPNKVDITIPAMTKNAFEGISGIAGSRDKVFGAIDLLYKKGINLGFKTCVLNENKSEIKDIGNFAHSLGALHRLDRMLFARLDGSREPYKYRGETKENSILRQKPQADCDFEVNGLKQNSNKQSPINQLTVHQELFKCGAGLSQAVITPSGELKMCLMIDFPKYKILSENRKQRAKNRGLKETWERLKELVASFKPDENYRCGKCELAPYCKWCPAKAWLYNRTFTSCEPESRAFAEIIRKKSKAVNQKIEIRK